MEKGQKVYTTYYSRNNTTAVVSEEPKKSVYSEDFTLVEEVNLTIQFADGSTVSADINNCVAYEDESELPELYFLPVSDQISFNKQEAMRMSLTTETTTSHVTYSGAGLPDIKRTFTGSRLEVQTLREELKTDLFKYGYNSISSHG